MNKLLFTITFGIAFAFQSFAQDSLSTPATKVKIPTLAELNADFYNTWKYVHTVRRTKDGYIIKVNEYKKENTSNIINLDNSAPTQEPNNAPPVLPPDEQEKKPAEYEATVEDQLRKIDEKSVMMVMYKAENSGNILAFNVLDARTRNIVFNDIEFTVDWGNGVPNLNLSNPYGTYQLRINYVSKGELILYDKQRDELVYFIRSTN